MPRFDGEGSKNNGLHASARPEKRAHEERVLRSGAKYETNETVEANVRFVLG